MTRIAADTVIDGRYQVIEHLGTGGMADVYCAHDLQLGRKVALKLLHARFAEDEEFLERFRREASSAAGLQHQHVVSVYDRGSAEGTSYIAMEFVSGRTLKQLVAEEGALDPARAVDLTVQILRAARFAHRRGVIHRDFKPQNVIVDEDGRAKVTDFGIARAGASDMTQTGSIMGTAQYLSPEQAQGHAVGARSDLYSIGIILYELLTGRVPFNAESAVTVALKQVSEEPVAPRACNPGVTPELEAVVLQALEKEPEKRFADADEFIAALEAASSRIPSPAAIAAAEAAAASLPAAATRQRRTPPPPPPPPPPQPADATGVLAPVEPHHVEAVRQPLPPPPPRGRTRWPWLALGALVVVALVVVIVMLVVPKDVPVPSVVGASVSAASQRLRSDGFKVAYVRDTSDKPRNEVTGQDPQGGTAADEGSTVTLNISDGPPLQKVPDVVGDGRRAARKELTEAGFDVDEQRVPSDGVPLDHVISQTPTGSALRGTSVELEVSGGPEQVPVPQVVGKSDDDARTALESAGFRVTVSKKEDAKKDPGTVLDQTPGPGTQAAHGSVVTLTIAEQPRQVEVPNVVGRSQNEATRTLSRAGLGIDVEEAPADSPDGDGVVQAQSVDAGEKADRDTTVTITVGVFDPDLNPDPGPTTTPPETTTTPVPVPG
ncbi:MAG: eukaryotic-like serine/threonine-protein kinase [Solirubrobacteraceae bacterium]|nr:eukaryotic-like serine/threonine-protein kinase [Solirubrobacteraceae bacterium]